MAGDCSGGLLLFHYDRRGYEGQFIIDLESSEEVVPVQMVSARL